MCAVTAIPLAIHAERAAVPLVPAALLLLYQRLLRAQHALRKLDIHNPDTIALVTAAVDLIAGDTLALRQYSVIAELARGAGLRSIREAATKKPAPVPPCGDTFFGLACGIAAACKQASHKNVVLIVLGKEKPQSVVRAIATAATYKLPAIFLSINHIPPRTSRLGPAAYQLHGVPRIAVESSDAIAIYRVAHEALERARVGYGPAFIDCMRSSIRVDAVEQLKTRLATMGDWSERHCREIEHQVAAEARLRRSTLRLELPVHLFPGWEFLRGTRD